MPNIVQEPIGRGHIVWLGVNQERHGFSAPRNTVVVCEDGVEGDRYRGMWRVVSGHDGDYAATDGVMKGDGVLNLRPITIVDEAEVCRAGTLTNIAITYGMLRENIVVRFESQNGNDTFSKLPPMSRMVIGHGEPDPKVLLLTEENGPCRTICNPVALHFGGGLELADSLRKHLKGRRGQMAMVRSRATKSIHLGDSFVIFPPML